MNLEEATSILKSIVESKTDHDYEDLTGASVSISITHSYTQLNYYLILFFGYKNRNSVQSKIPINKELYTKFSKIIVQVIESLKKDIAEDDINDILNIVSNTNRTIDSNTPNYNYNLNNSNLITKEYDKESDFSLNRKTKFSKTSEEYKKALDVYLNKFIDEQNIKLEEVGAKHRVLDYDSFILSLEAKDYEYVNFVKAYRTWNRNHIERVKNAR